MQAISWVCVSLSWVVASGCSGTGDDVPAVDPGNDSAVAIDTGGGADLGVDSTSDVGVDSVVPAVDVGDSEVGGDATAGGRPLAEIAAGTWHTCALETDGTVLCWGRNDQGQVGDGTLTTPRLLPTAVLLGGARLTDVAEIVASDFHSCARKTGGTVLCWGDNASGQVGDGTITSPRPSPTPVLVAPGGAPLTGVAEIAAGIGSLHSCARQLDGTVLCWGQNVFGEIGDGTTTKRPSPTRVLVAPGGAALTSVAAITTGLSYTCARRTDGTALCWGYNKSGVIGDGTTTDRSTPTAISGLSDVAEIKAAYSHTCARLTDGTVRCWGDNSLGMLGDGTTTERHSPTPVLVAPGGAMLTRVAQLAVGGAHTCALETDGAVLCWGGEIGDGTTTPRSSPTAVLVAPGGAPLTDVAEISAGIGNTCARKTDGTVLCWGYNKYGMNGDGTTTDRHSPTPLKW